MTKWLGSVTWGLPLAIVVLQSGASAQELTPASAEPQFEYFVGTGTINLDAGEYVYEDGRLLSQLDWETRGAALLSIGASYHPTPSWRISGKVDLAGSGDSFMEDRDWYWPETTEWTDQSLHPGTDLSHYINLQLTAERAVFTGTTTELFVGAGAGYTDVKWDAPGGPYIYTDQEFRDDVGFSAEGKVISYRQRVPSLYLSASSSHTIDRLVFAANVRAGASFGYKGVDDHWVRELRFIDRMDPAPLLGVNLTASYAVTESRALYLSTDFTQVFEADGDVNRFNTATSEDEDSSATSGADFRSLSISFGVKGTF